MAHANFSAFSPDSSFLAICSDDGKLKIYETLTNRLKLEYVPNLHLSSPCSAITWIKASSQTNNPGTPWKKKKRKSISEDVSDSKQVVAMGSVNGTISLYDISSACVVTQLQDGHNSTITALAWSASTGLFSAAEDKQIVQWDLHDNSVKNKWKSGKGKITAIVVMSEGKFLLTADRLIKWWDLSTKQVIHTFSGHTSQITSLNIVNIDGKTSHLLSSSVNDSFISVWSLYQPAKEQQQLSTLLTQDEPLSLSAKYNKTEGLTVLTTTRTGNVHVFKCKVNEKETKPIKPSLTMMVVSDSKKECVQPIPVLMSNLAEGKIMLAYGSYLNIHFELVEPDFSDETQCLIRSDDSKKSKERKEENLTRMKATETENNVEYVLHGATKRQGKTSTGAQLPLKDRLENLSLDDKNVSDKSQKGESMVHLLIQGLQSKEKSILDRVLYEKKATNIQSTVAKLPVQAVIPLLKELTVMMQGKTYPCKIATMWLSALVTTHAGQLMSHPDIVEALTPILSFVDMRSKLLPGISKLRGRVNLIMGQISNTQNQENNEKEEEDALLVFEDNGGSSDETEMGDVESSSESDNNWDELSNLESEDENIKSDDDNVSMCS